MPTLKTRRHIYQVATAALPLLTFYGLVADQAAPLWLGVLGAALATGPPALAAANSRDQDQDQGPQASP